MIFADVFVRVTKLISVTAYVCKNNIYMNISMTVLLVTVIVIKVIVISIIICNSNNSNCKICNI